MKFSRLLKITVFLLMIYVFYLLVATDIGFYLSALKRGYNYPSLKIGLGISIVYLLYCIAHLTYKIFLVRTIDVGVLVLQLKMILGMVFIMLSMFFISVFFSI